MEREDYFKPERVEKSMAITKEWYALEHLMKDINENAIRASLTIGLDLDNYNSMVQLPILLKNLINTLNELEVEDCDTIIVQSKYNDAIIKEFNFEPVVNNDVSNKLGEYKNFKIFTSPNVDDQIYLIKYDVIDKPNMPFMYNK